jgi:hypothetical protein
MISLNKLWRDKRGNVLAIGGATLPLLVGAAGLATDTIQWTLWKRELQRASDSAAIAGVYERVASKQTSGVKDVVAHDLTLNHHTGIPLATGYPQITFPADSGDKKDQVRVVLAVSKALPFSSMFMTAAPTIIAGATAASVPGSDEYCVVSLENSASKTGITVGGSTSIDMNCGMISNSPAANSALANGTASKVKATVIAAVGGVQASSKWDVPDYDPYTTPVDDPYKNINPTSSEMSDCAANPPALTDGTANASGLTGGCFSSLTVGSNKTLTLGPGTYYITGRNAATAGDVKIQGTLNCNGCTIVLTNKDMSSTAKIGTFDMNAGAKVSLKAPSTGKYKGMAVFQDRRATDTTGTGSPNRFNGGGSQVIEGALYFPSQSITYNGEGTATAVCTQFVARRVIFTGNNTTTNRFEKGSNCGLIGLGGIGGGRRVRLVA